MIDKNTDNWHKLPWWLKCWFFFNFLNFRPTKDSAKRVELISHVSGFIFCALGLFNQAALAGGLCMLFTAYVFYFLIRQGDAYGLWYEPIK